MRDRIGFVVLCVVALAAATITAIRRPFWYDELCTLTVAHLGSIQEIWVFRHFSG